MEFIASNWWLWFAVMIVCAILAFRNQIKRMKSMVSSRSMDGATTSFFSGLGMLVFTGLLASIAGVLFVLSLILNVIDYAK